MSTARFNTLQNAAGSKSVPVDTVVDGSAKAWVNFNGSGTVAIRSSFNVSSITDNGLGDYTVNFTTAFANTNYCVAGSSRHNGGGSGGTVSPAGSSIGAISSIVTTSSVRIRTVVTNDGLTDTDMASVIIYR